MFFLALALAIVTASGALYLRRDTPSSRAWEKQNGIIDERFAFVFLPSFSLTLFGLALMSASGLSHDHPLVSGLLLSLGLPFTLIGSVGAITGLFGTRYPEWLIPRWRRESPYRTPPKRRGRRRKTN
ncbi:MAG: hypothetical protein Q4P71_07055 [Actinomycetaceae bacterium]|nr:hypothetical protein [Actinomycetaceae bacterium]